MAKNDFREKRVLITGGSSGIGLALAREFAGRGASVWLVARDSAKLKSACEDVRSRSMGGSNKVGTSVADVAVESQAQAAAAEAKAALGGIDILVNNAGITYPGYIEQLPTSTFREMMDVNFFGTVHMVQAVLPDMLARGGGHIVNISSLVAILAVFGYSAYGASKWAVRGYSDILRSELKPRGIHLTVAFPPDTDTPQLAFESTIKPFETKAIASNNKVYSAEKVAKDVVDGVRRNRYLILTGADSIFYYWLANLLGPLQYPVMDMFVADAIRKRQKTEKPKG